MRTHAGCTQYPCDLFFWTFDLKVSACRGPAMDYMSTDFGADSSIRFSFIARTNKQTNIRDWTPYPTPADVQPAWWWITGAGVATRCCQKHIETNRFWNAFGINVHGLGLSWKMCEGHMDEPTEIAIAHVTVKYDAAPNSGEATERGVWGGGWTPHLSWGPPVRFAQNRWDFLAGGTPSNRLRQIVGYRAL